MNVIAIDPGLEGAGAVVDACGELVHCFDLPTIGEGAQRRIDAANLADLLRAHTPYALAIVEQVAARPGQGVSSMFRFGRSYGTILGVVGTLAIPVRHVTPAKWKRALGLSADGEGSRAWAIETWPMSADLFARKTRSQPRRSRADRPRGHRARRRVVIVITMEMHKEAARLAFRGPWAFIV
jgi:crossover junction endodeoxyribonuclease RuvC